MKHSSIDASAKLSQLNDWFSEERREERVGPIGGVERKSKARAYTIDPLRSS